jgi:hypothetical protein
MHFVVRCSMARLKVKEGGEEEAFLSKMTEVN